MIQKLRNLQLRSDRPTHNTSPPDSSDAYTFRVWASALIEKVTRNLQKRLSRNKSAQSGSQGSGQNTTIISHINWCVDSAPWRTILHSICLEQKKERLFIDELYRSYKKLRGWRWYFSMTTCTEIKLIKVRYLTYPLRYNGFSDSPSSTLASMKQKKIL